MDILKPKALGAGVTHISRLQENCSTCKFWRLAWSTSEKDNLLPPEEHCGYCRRYPPMLEPDPPQSFPISQANMWCGEFARKVITHANPQT